MSADVGHGRRWANAARRLVGAVIVALSLLFIYRAMRFFSADPAVLGKYLAYRSIIVGHIVGGMLALLLGPVQLSRTLRARYRRAHRVSGRIYVSAVVVGAGCALILASTTALTFGWAYALSLHVLASVWGVSALLAWRTAVQRQFRQHEQWAERSYIATVAFVAQSLSLEIPWIAGLGDFAELAPTIIWSSWTVPLFVYEGLRGSRR